MSSNFSFAIFPKLYLTFQHNITPFSQSIDRRRPPGEAQGNSLWTWWNIFKSRKDEKRKCESKIKMSACGHSDGVGVNLINLVRTFSFILLRLDIITESDYLALYSKNRPLIKFNCTTQRLSEIVQWGSLIWNYFLQGLFCTVFAPRKKQTKPLCWKIMVKNQLSYVLISKILQSRRSGRGTISRNLSKILYRCGVGCFENETTSDWTKFLVLSPKANA